MSKKVTIEIDERYADILCVTCIGLNDGEIYSQAEVAVTSKNVPLNGDTELRVDHTGIFNQRSLKRDAELYSGCIGCEHRNTCVDAYMEHSQHCNNYNGGKNVDCGWR